MIIVIEVLLKLIKKNEQGNKIVCKPKVFKRVSP